MENQLQINKQAEKLALKLFKDFKAKFKAKNKSRTKYKKYTLDDLKALEPKSTIRLIYNALYEHPNIDRHSVLGLVRTASLSSIGQSTVSGRLFELQNSGLVRISGKQIGRFGKRVRLYAIAGIEGAL